ncbi:Peptidase family M50/AN1-like Zinc finger [Candidatus Nitrososphaera evergladensis SR1]|uniref:Peptidase family M50/AN1-like Zinc finger n=1 Tax=Candidatus Nitrososphaera evergladensis SR1 TaxID=1459636 RepID=A0A075MPX9_9ARCH|nr:AN1-type zinc finger domain-containing protein [Candidatus Nitrososphaera evergladensis]AIF82922.1 Peptidase family M50/AN1-like Zinc finger [Candidatus Nitrososphaera evergladensis SR1]
MECGICGREEEIPFRCRYCKGYFCSEHRLPPNHNCLFINDFMRQPEKDREFVEYVSGMGGGSVGERAANIVKNTVLLRFSKTEIAHLAIGMTLVAAVGMSLFGFRFQPAYIAIFVSAFLLHELAHKFLAQFYRAWAEFRVIFFGAIVTAMSALPFFPFKFIAPGAVFISGSISERRNGKISLVGPLTNVALCTGMLLAFMLSDSPSQLLVVGARFNAWIAIFNLIPFMGLDGQKIFAWNKLVWVLTLAASALLYIAVGFASGRGLGFP